MGEWRNANRRKEVLQIRKVDEWGKENRLMAARKGAWGGTNFREGEWP